MKANKQPVRPRRAFTDKEVTLIAHSVDQLTTDKLYLGDFNYMNRNEVMELLQRF
ncbi:hypothetical protein AFI02nite_27650 [Aliivibrio fischeri]|uniref:Uncharacterized protein n=1 Tax=Aliivibrio fischeri TaxID=668 RepID=A0A510UJP1_ALIFS|nr:hypothetical protein AFI02nite_27650 [Aliivibrio fischeri]